MNKLPWLLLLFALAGVGGLLHIIRTSAARGPVDYLDAARAHLEADPQDVQSAFRELGRGIELAERHGDDTVLAELLEERGRLSRRRKAYLSAEADFLRLLDNEFFDSADAQRELAEIDLSLGDWDAAEEHVDLVLADQPKSGWYLQLRARIRRARLDATWNELEDLIEESLPDTYSSRAIALAREIVYLPTKAPLRATRSNALAATLASVPPNRRDQIASLLDTSTEQAGGLREDLYACLYAKPLSEASRTLLDILLAAERPQDAVEIGLALQRFPEARNNRRFLQLLATALTAVDRSDIAEQVIQAAVPEQGGVWMDREFLPLWSSILYENGSWARLAWVAVELGKSADSGPNKSAIQGAAEYYRGIALANGVNPQAGVSPLWRFVSSVPDKGPVPDAIGRAWMTMAGLARDREDWAAYDQALRNCTMRAPTYSGDAWLELAQHRLGKKGPLEPILIQLTHALSLLPHRVDELLPLWTDVGTRSLLETDRDLELLRNKLLGRGEWYDATTQNPYERYELARMHLAAGQEAGVITVCRRLLSDYPNLLPVVDLLIEVYVGLDQLNLAVPLLLQRLRLEPDDAQTLLTLRDLDGDGQLSPTQRLELMRLDPHFTGILVFGRHLLGTGGADLAAAALGEADMVSLGAQGRLLAAEIQLARKDPVGALGHLNRIPPTDRRYASAVRMKVNAAIAMRELDRIEFVLKGVENAEYLDPDEVLAATRTLLLQGLWAPATLLLERLDELPESRSGEVVAQLALARMLGRNATSARETLERLLAFRDDGVAEMGELLMAVQERNWTDLPTRVRAIRSTDFDPSPLASCLLAALEERLEEASRLAAKGLEEDPASGEWALAVRAVQSLRSEPLTPFDGLGVQGIGQTKRFLRGVQPRPQDPRRALAILLALEFDEWSVWALAELGNLTADPAGAMWPTYLAAKAHLRLDGATEAGVLLEALTIAFPAFEPAWNELIDELAKTLGRPEHPTLLRLRAARAAALGAPDGTGVDARLARALEDEAAGRIDRAVATVRSCLEDRPRHLASQIVLGRLLQTRGELKEAVSTYGRFFESASRDLAYEYAPAFIDALDFASKHEAIDEATFVAELQALAARVPSDPLVAVRRARHEVESQRDSLAVGIGRGWLLLDRFRERADGTPIELLRPGSTRLWLDLLIEYDPDRAEQFIGEELAMLPQSLEHWLMLGRVYEAQGRRADAATHYQTVRAMVPAPAALLSAAELQADLGRSIDHVDKLINLIRRVGSRPDDDPELELLRARALVNSSGPRVAEGLTMMRELWDRRQSIGDRLSLTELARNYALACLHRGVKADRSGASAAMKIVVAANDDPSRVDHLALLEHYAQKILDPPASASEGDAGSADDAAGEAGDDSGDDAFGDDASGNDDSAAFSAAGAEDEVAASGASDL